MTSRVKMMRAQPLWGVICVKINVQTCNVQNAFRHAQNASERCASEHAIMPQHHS